MKKALIKDSVIEIKKTSKRFLSILLIVLLGVGFFAGIKATSPDMQVTADQYFDQQDLMDIQILSSLGLTDSDVEQIEKIQGVEAVMPSYSRDAIIQIDQKDEVVKLHSLPKKGEEEKALNKVKLIEGSMPKNKQECLVEESFLRLTGHQIGYRISIEPEKIEGQEDFLQVTEMTIVGSICSPLYISKQKGSTKLGSGKISFYLYLPDEAISSDVYTEIYLKVANTKKLNSFGKEYEEIVNTVKDRLEQIKEERQETRYNEVVEEETEELEQAEQTFQEKKKEAEDELIQAEQKIEQGKEELEKGEASYQEEKRKVEKEFQQGKKELQQAQQRIQEQEETWKEAKPDALAKLEETEKQKENLRKQQETLQITLSQVEQGLREVTTQKTAIEKQIIQDKESLANETDEVKKEEWRKKIAEKEASLVLLEKNIQTLEGQRTSVIKFLNPIQDAVTEITNQVEKGKKELQIAEETIKQAKTEIERKQLYLEQQEQKANSELKKAKEKLQEGKKEIEENQIQLEDAKKETQDKLEQAQNELDDAKDTIKKIKKPDWYLLDRGQNQGIAGYRQDCERIANIGKVFPVVFFVVAALISLTSMTRMVEEQRVQIGTLKALRICSHANCYEILDICKFSYHNRWNNRNNDWI